MHKMSYIRGFHLVASDGEIGHVDDFLIGDDWRVRHLVIDTSNFVGGKGVLIPPSAIVAVDAPAKKIRVALTREQVASSPAVDSADIELIETLPPVIM